jgi:pyruvate dehydrogenase (quinone)
MDSDLCRPGPAFGRGGCDISNQNVAGLLGLAADTPEQVRPMITQALRHEGPALVAVRDSRQELSMPPNLTFDLIRDFGIFMVKAVLNGRGDETIDLAKVNLKL